MYLLLAEILTTFISLKKKISSTKNQVYLAVSHCLTISSIELNYDRLNYKESDHGGRNFATVSSQRCDIEGGRDRSATTRFRSPNDRYSFGNHPRPSCSHEKLRKNVHEKSTHSFSLSTFLSHVDTHVCNTRIKKPLSRSLFLLPVLSCMKRIFLKLVDGSSTKAHGSIQE